MQTNETTPKRSPREIITERGNALRAEVGFEPTDNAVDLGSIFLTQISMDVLQSDGGLLHPDSIGVRSAGIGFAFVCFMAVPVLSALNDKKLDEDRSGFLVRIASSVFQCFDEDSKVAIYKSGVNIFRSSVESAAHSEKINEFTNQIDTLVMGWALDGSSEVLDALNNRYQAFQKLFDM